MAVVVLVAAGCGSQEGRSPAAANSKASAHRIPALLDAIESTAEDAFDLALAGNFAAVRKRSTKLSVDWAAYQDQATRDGVPAPAISTLDRAIHRLMTVSRSHSSKTELARATNALSGSMPSFYDVYHPTVPSRVLALDYLGREVRLDGFENDFARASKDVNRIASIWQSLRVLVVGAGGSRQATAFDGSVNAERRAVANVDRAALDETAVAELELVDTLETVFTNSREAAG